MAVRCLTLPSNLSSLIESTLTLNSNVCRWASCCPGVTRAAVTAYCTQVVGICAVCQGAQMGPPPEV